MRGRSLAAFLAVLLVGPLAVPTSYAQSGAGRRALPLILELEGVIAKDRDEAARIGFTTASFGVLGETTSVRVWLGVNAARTAGRDGAPNGKDVLEAVSPYQPNFQLAGQPDDVARLTGLAPGTTVRVQGLVDRGPRTFLVRSVTLPDAR